MLKAQILLSSLVLMCGQILFWRRRDNVLGYLQAGFFFASFLVPVLGTTIIDDSDPVIVTQYAHLLTLGAVAYFVGLAYGAMIGTHHRLPSVSFGNVLEPIPRFIVRRSRQAAVGAILALGLSFLLFGYIPFLAADRVGAKYGVGVYKAGLDRAALLFHVALRMGSIVMPVMLAMFVRRRRGLDAALAAVLGVGLLLTLSRGSAFIGPVVFLVAWLVTTRAKARQIVAVACLAFVAATLVNEVVKIARPVASASFATRVAASAPEISDQLGFLNGFQLNGGQHVGLRTVIAGVSLNKGEYNPSSYALRIRTGLSDISDLPAGGLRLPAAIWGYSAFGYPGAAVWSLLSGIAIGWGTAFLRRRLAGVQNAPGQVVNLVLAWVFFQGTFAVLGEFYFPERVELVSLALALALSRRIAAGPSPGSRAEPAPAVAEAGTGQEAKPT